MSQLNPVPDTASAARFSLANLRVENGRIDFDDRVAHRAHSVDRLSVGLPLLANTPAQTDIFVEPHVTARVDGRALRLAGRTKPFAASRESDLVLHLDALDAPSLAGYLPLNLPYALTGGVLSADLRVRFLSGARPLP
jgi:hypothetical protein